MYKFGSLTNLNTNTIYNLTYKDNFVFTIGRNKKCNIVLKNKSISNIACIIKCDYVYKKVYIFGGNSKTNICISLDNNDGLSKLGTFIKFPHSNWMDVSINGYIYLLRSKYKINITNELIDKTLIDIGGYIYIWRSIDVKTNIYPHTYVMSTDLNLNYIFDKCNHKINKKTAEFWNNSKILTYNIYNDNMFNENVICPFCFKISNLFIIK